MRLADSAQMIRQPRSARQKGGTGLAVTVLLLVLVLSILAATALGQVYVAPWDIIKVIGRNIFGQGLFGASSSVDPQSLLDQQIIWQLRLPRVILTALVGAALALAGAVLQGVVGNPLADPFVIGVSSGSSLGAISVMALGVGSVAGFGVSGAAFAGALITLLLLVLLAQRAGKLSGNRIVLAGVALGQAAMAGTTLIQLHVDPAQVRGILFWMLGSTAGAQWQQLPILALAIATSAVLVLSRARQLNALALGEDDAIALGIGINALRWQLLIASAVLTAVAVTVAGAVGFVGLIIPHALRMLGFTDYRKLLPMALLAGASFLVLIDLASRLIDPPNEYPLTIFTAALGTPFFLWLLRTRNHERAS
ncbi:FecCD family ABC transporter permease [Renibacterium salmoninarum]|nr:iron ABC transporter permease [Renibacterium salmoninarum]